MYNNFKSDYIESRYGGPYKIAWVRNGVTYYVYSESEIHKINFFGASFMADKFLGKRHWVNLSGSVGYLSIKYDFNSVITDLNYLYKYKPKFTGSTVGFELNAGYKYFIFKNIGVGVDVNLPFSAAISTYENPLDGKTYSLKELSNGYKEKNNIFQLGLLVGVVVKL